MISLRCPYTIGRLTINPIVVSLRPYDSPAMNRRSFPETPKKVPYSESRAPRAGPVIPIVSQVHYDIIHRQMSE